MRFAISSFAALLALSTSLLVVATPIPAPAPAPDVPQGYTVNADGTVSLLGLPGRLDPAIIAPSQTKREPSPVHAELPRTNAERIAHGLPLKRARIRSPRRKQARTPNPSPISAYIQIKNRSTGAVLGFVSATPTKLGNYGNFAPDTSTALHLQIPSTAIAGKTSILTLNGPSSSAPYFGGVVGAASTSANIGSGSYNYMFVSGTSETAAGATPQTGGTTYTGASVSGKKVESAIWTWNAVTGELTPTWVNTDGTSRVASLFWQNAGQNAYFGLTGDYTAYYNQFNSQGAVTPLSFYVYTGL